MDTTATLTAKTHQLFIDLVEDASNWSGTPLFEGTTADRGNLTHLKKAGLLDTDNDGRDIFVFFTQAGADYAAKHGHDIQRYV